jgi:hypothetical protein
MSEIDAINERLKRGEEKFSEVSTALSGITEHLKRQDAMYADLGAKIDAQGKSTAAIVDMWDGGVNATRFFCRLARAWEWVVRQIFSKRFIGLVLGYAALHWLIFKSLPDWTHWVISLYKVYKDIA